MYLALHYYKTIPTIHYIIVLLLSISYGSQIMFKRTKSLDTAFKKGVKIFLQSLCLKFDTPKHGMLWFFVVLFMKQ